MFLGGFRKDFWVSSEQSYHTPKLLLGWVKCPLLFVPDPTKNGRSQKDLPGFHRDIWDSFSASAWAAAYQLQERNTASLTSMASPDNKHHGGVVRMNCEKEWINSFHYAGILSCNIILLWIWIVPSLSCTQFISILHCRWSSLKMFSHFAFVAFCTPGCMLSYVIRITFFWTLTLSVDPLLEKYMKYCQVKTCHQCMCHAILPYLPKWYCFWTWSILTDQCPLHPNCAVLTPCHFRPYLSNGSSSNAATACTAATKQKRKVYEVLSSMKPPSTDVPAHAARFTDSNVFHLPRLCLWTWSINTPFVRGSVGFKA